MSEMDSETRVSVQRNMESHPVTNDENEDSASTMVSENIIEHERIPRSSSTNAPESAVATDTSRLSGADSAMALTMWDRSISTDGASSKKMRTASPPLTVTRAPRPVASSSSDFSIDLLPLDRIQKRTLHPWSVHHSLTTSNWVATIARPCAESGTSSANGSNGKLRYAQFVFKKEREAKKFCKAYAPPKLMPAAECFSCKKQGSFRYCRNCGVACCDADSTRWGSRMLPKTYMPGPGSAVVRVCKACDWLSNAFCMALLQGRAQDAIQLYDTGNINLRTCFADIHREAMFPVHCAVMGGSLDCLKFLVDTHLCPISVRVDPKTAQPLSVQTSASRTLLDLAMTGRPKIDVLTFLVGKGLSITDMKHTELAFKTLEAILKSPAASPATLFQQMGEVHLVEDNGGVMDHESVATMTAIEDACNICFERNMDCVLTPCGHQVCCTECGKQLDKCPVCKAPCSFLRIYRQ